MAGWITAAATIMTIGVVTHGHWIWMAALLGMWRVLIDYWIAPRVLGHELEIRFLSGPAGFSNSDDASAREMEQA